MKYKTKAELKALAYDKFLDAAEDGSIDMKVSAITLTAIYHAEMSIQNNKIAKDEVNETRTPSYNEFNNNLECGQNKTRPIKSTPSIRITKEYLDYLLVNRYISKDAHASLLKEMKADSQPNPKTKCQQLQK